MEIEAEITLPGTFQVHLLVAVSLATAEVTSTCPDKSLSCEAFAENMTMLFTSLPASIVPGMRQEQRGVI